MNNTFAELICAIIWFVLTAITLGYYLMIGVSLGIIIVLVVIIIFWAINMLIIAIKLDEKIKEIKDGK